VRGDEEKGQAVSDTLPSDLSRLPLAAGKDLDAICERFEAAWHGPSRPRIEDFLKEDHDGDIYPVLERELILLETYYRRRDGENPRFEEYAARFPKLESSWLESVFQDHAQGGPDQGVRGLETTPQGHAGAPVPAHPRYRVDRTLGKGSFGTVYLARDEQLRRLVAIKVPRHKLVTRPEDAEAYLTEARIVANLDHPNIVPVYDFGSTAEWPCFIVSKFIEGGSLAHKINERRPSHDEAAELVATIAGALRYAHGKGLVHRDIKPGNILIETSGKPFLVDFGLALKEENVGHGPKYAGTPAYMSPEQARGEGHRVDGRSDVFSLGVVLYELLAGRRPYPGQTHEELMEQVAKHDPPPPRQIYEDIPKELERVCLKALSKRASERYQTAKEMADDLRYFLDQSTRHHGSAAALASSPPSSGHLANAAPAASDSQPVKIVPKGLRSFDEHDTDFFLELLPGPRDRNGLPDNLRFWKSRIEETDPDKTFAVGVICGPSGCGKSSLVKAGLLPRLSQEVITIYLEATGADTEARLLSGLRKRFPALPANQGVRETLAALRIGQGITVGKKVLIVLDQFEQWLHSVASRERERPEPESTELVQALRHCDGERLQCIVMVRDDFWMAVIRFMRELEVRLVEGHNSAAVDLIDPDHAKKVLAAFGRAFGKLPGDFGAATKEQCQFVNQAVEALAQEGKVICVRLALFAEMMKTKPWTQSTLKAVGGAAGVGVNFLEETFSAANASPEHRYHQKAAQDVLKSLLPEAGTDLKGNMRSYAELLAATGYAGHQEDFDDLLRILDGELRLITPTDTEGVAIDERRKAQEEISRDSSSLTPSPLPLPRRYYQLTHDYLVPSLREWLTRKQRETRAGRAELVLADRASVWNARPENRQLPSLVQSFQICWLTRNKNWTPPQRKMMRRATRYHGVRGLLAVVFLALLAWGGYQGHGKLEAFSLQGRLLNADTQEVPGIVREMASYRGWIDPLLQDAYKEAQATNEPRKQLHASLALLPVDTTQKEYLYKRLLEAAPQEVPVLRDALAPHKDELLNKLWAVALKPPKGQEQQRLRAACALAAYDPNRKSWDNVQDQVASDFVAVPVVYVERWMQALWPVRAKLLDALSAVYRDGQRDPSERNVATNILANYAAEYPHVLADLVMDADEKQFALLFPKLQDHGAGGLDELLWELDKEVAVEVKEVLKARGTLAQDDDKVKISLGVSVPAKVFRVPMHAGKRYLMAMYSTELDSFLMLRDETGNDLAVAHDSAGNQYATLAFTPSQDVTYKIYTASLKSTGSFVFTVTEIIGQDAKEKLAKRQANAAAAILRMGRREKVWPLLKHTPDPRTRSYLADRLGPLGADAGVIVQRLVVEPDVTIRRALILSLGEFAGKSWPAGDSQAIMKTIQDIYRTTDDAGIHESAEWLLRHWEQEEWLVQINEEWAKNKSQRKQRLQRIRNDLASHAGSASEHPAVPLVQWYVNAGGQTMVVIPGPVEFLMGSPAEEKDRFDNEFRHRKRIGRSFGIAAKPVTIDEYRRSNINYANFTFRFAPAASCPAANTNWLEAAKYCNWLSEQEGIPKDQWCYETNIKGDLTSTRAHYLDLAGYRLPTEAEWECACRAGAATSRSYGESDELLGKHAWYMPNAENRSWPVGTKKPNDFGLFDMHGNVWNWCQDRYVSYPKGEEGQVFDDIEEGDLRIKNGDFRVLRGGWYGTLASGARSADRVRSPSGGHSGSGGFRPARTFR
jgi:serine/threonine protein kinase/formylglycine-generating enzyme required for sulfatase activity